MRVPLVLIPLLAGSCSAWREHAAKPTPQRPTVSVNTSTTAAGTFELEAGAGIDIDEFYDTPFTLKYGAAANTELFVGWSPWLFQERPGPNSSGTSDVYTGARVRIVEETDGVPAVALRFAGKLPTASTSEGLGTGELDVLFAASVFKRFGSFATNGFYELGVLGNPFDNTQDLEHTFTLLGDVALSDDWNALAEVAGRYRPEGGPEPAVLTVALAHVAARYGVFDFGFRFGLNSDARDAVFQIGWTQNFGGPGSSVSTDG